MKTKLPLAVTFLLFISTLYASLPQRKISPVVPEFLKVENFVRYNIPEFEKLSGKKLSPIQRMYFKKLQRKLAKTNYTSEDSLLPYYDVQKQKFKLDTLWFVLGVIIGPFAVLFSYTTHKQSRNKHLSALIGFGVFIIWFGWVFLF